MVIVIMVKEPGSPGEGQDATRIEMHVSDRKRYRRVMPGTSPAQQSHLDTSSHIGEQRGSLRRMLDGIRTTSKKMPGAIDLDTLEVAFVDDDAHTENVMTYDGAEEMLDTLDKAAWGRLKTHAESPNPRVRNRARHVLGYGIVDDQPASDEAKKRYNLDKLNDDNY